MMQTETTPQITYRRTKSGDWVAFGPAGHIRRNGRVIVAKRDGTREERIVRETGRTFRVDGREMVYGYLQPRQPRGRSYRPNYAPRSCDDCQDIEDMSDAQGCARHRGNPRN